MVSIPFGDGFSFRNGLYQKAHCNYRGPRPGARKYSVLTETIDIFTQGCKVCIHDEDVAATDFENTFKTSKKFRYGLRKDTPVERPVQPRPVKDSKVIELPRVGGLHHRYEWEEAA